MNIITNGNLPFIPDSYDYSPSLISLAVDIGTTTIAVVAWSLSERKILSTVAEKNLQSKYGADVINRIDFSINNESNVLHKTIINQLEKMFVSALTLSSQKMLRGFRPIVSKIVITGNTTMLSFVCDFSVKQMATIPFLPESKFDFEIEWGKISPSISVIPKNTKVYFPPIVGAFIGADTICSLIAADFSLENKKPFLLADIGTNSEMALFIPETEEKPSRILCTSAAAGPAFEAMNISFGMSSINGAIDNVFFENGNLKINTIGGGIAKGICGSGLISSISVFLENDFIDETGAIIKNKNSISEEKIDLTNSVSISQNDIRNLQLAKSAVRTGIDYLIEKLPQNFSIDKFYLAGGFGSKINLSNSVKIGLFPENLLDKSLQIGNAALFGASALLFSESLVEKARQIAKKSIQINLAAVPDFQKRFINGLNFEFDNENTLR